MTLIIFIIAIVFGAGMGMRQRLKRLLRNADSVRVEIEQLLAKREKLAGDAQLAVDNRIAFLMHAYEDATLLYNTLLDEWHYTLLGKLLGYASIDLKAE